MHASAHVDTFTRSSLPSRDQWPDLIFTIPSVQYPSQLNCVEPLLDRHVRDDHGDKIAIRSLDESWTYRDLQSRVNRIANILATNFGIVPGNRVLLRFPNTPLFAACYLAVLKCGAVAVPTMPLLRKSELLKIVNKAQVNHAICDAQLVEEFADLSFAHALLSDELMQLMESADDNFDAIKTASDDVALIAFTSGTTGEPKGCMHFHSDVMAMCDTFSKEVLKPKPDDIFIGSPPLAFTFGLGGLLAFPLYAGASTVLLDNVAPPQLAEAIASSGATICFTAPTAYKVLLKDHIEQLSSLRVAVSAGEHLPKPLYVEWTRRTGKTMIDGIGATEMIHIFLSMTGEADKPGSTGVPVPGYEIRIVDESLNELPAGQEGLLALRGPTGCKYLADSRQTDYVKGGWNLTGDVFRCDEDGYYWYVARGDDMIISSGYNISGPEVEEALLGHAAVLECAVVAAADEVRGNVPKAFVVLADGTEPSAELVTELQEFVKQTIAPYKYPRAIEFLDALPKTQTGKIQRFALR